MTVRSADIEFPEKGLVLVVGHNVASDGKMDSVGAGKTALGEALSRVLVGVDGRYSTLGHYSHDSAGDMYVRAETVLKGQPFIVELGHKCKELSGTGEGLQYTMGDAASVARGHVRETREEINAALNITPALAEWSVYIDGDRLKFNKMSERESVALLMTALQQPSWDAIGRKAGQMFTDARADVTAKDGILQSAKAQLQRETSGVHEARQNLETEEKRLEAAQAALAQQVKRLTETLAFNTANAATLEARQKAIKKELKSLELSSANQYAIVEKRRAIDQTKVAEKEIKRDEVSDRVASTRSAKCAADQRLREMLSEPINCPTCAKPWDAVHSKAELEAQQKVATAARRAYDARVTEMSGVDTDLASLRQKVRDATAEIAAMKKPQQMTTLSYEYEENETAINEARYAVEDSRRRLQAAEQGPSRTNAERYAAILTERENKVENLTADVENSATKLAEAKEIAKIVGYWAEGFGPTGIPNLILEEAIHPLNETAQRISKLMTGGTIEITYATSRALASGRASSELVVTVNNKIGSKRIEGGSKGESALINLVIAETLSEVGSVSKRVGFRFYDEVLSNQDSTVRRSILSYLKDVADKTGILIFVVDHSAEAASFADHILLAEKTGKGTTFSWQ